MAGGICAFVGILVSYFLGDVPAAVLGFGTASSAVTGALGGLDALLSMAQMPAGIPVATVAIGDAGARNAGHLAMGILALADPGAKEKLVKGREANRRPK